MLRERGREKDKAISEEEIVESTQIVNAPHLNSQGRKQKSEQSQDQRRKIRTTYRKLITDTSVKKQELIQPEADGLVRALEKADSLYQQVSMPREAALDSEFLSLASQLGVEQTSRLNTGFRTHDPYEFLTKLRHFMLKEASLRIETSQRDSEEEPTDELNWEVVAKEAQSFFRRTPSVGFLYGPLIVEHVSVAKKERQRKEREKIGDKVMPEEISDAQTDQEALDKATSKRVEDLRGYLEKAQHMDFLKFIIDPNSFSQTIENIFHYAFLVKDGQAAFKLDEKGNPVAEPAQPPLQEDYTSGKAERRQCVVAMTYDMWQQLKEKHHIMSGYLPHRKSSSLTINSQQSGSNTQTQALTRLNKSKKLTKKDSSKRMEITASGKEDTILENNQTDEVTVQKHKKKGEQSKAQNLTQRTISMYAKDSKPTKID